MALSLPLTDNYSYELPHRIHDAHIYPVTAPNGSTLVLYGHSQGLRLLWRGGRKRKDASDLANGASPDQVMVLDGNEEENEFEADEEELDPDCPYPSIMQELNLDIQQEVLHVAVPSLHSSSLTPPLLRTTALVAIAQSDGGVRLLQIPLAPPADIDKAAVAHQIARSKLGLASDGPIPSDLAMKFYPVDNQAQTGLRRQQEGVEGHLLVAAASRKLKIWIMSVTADTLAGEEEGMFEQAQSVPLSSPATHLAFHPSTRFAQLLLVDVSGSSRIYDPYAQKTLSTRPGSSDSQLQAPRATGSPGKWIMTYHAGFPSTKEQDAPPALARRKKILDAKWVLGGKCILALMEDGQWGIWDLTGGLRDSKRGEDFVLDGYLSSASHVVDTTKSKKGLSGLAPMTPNTRKAKSEELFGSASKASGVAPGGGISVSSTAPRTGQTDESIVMWFNADVYTITSMQQFWQRSTSNGGGFGSLYAPGLAHITDIDLISENITSISQFRSQSSSAGIGHMNTQRDLLVTGEHRAVILQNLRPATPSRGLFQQQLAERPASRDTAMVDTGFGSDLDGINAVLDSMNSANASRKVGFAH